MVGPDSADVVIAGGGLVGGTLAIGLAQQGIRTVVIDQEDPHELANSAKDGRTTAVSHGSRLIFEKLGIWDKISPAAEPILHIRVFEQIFPGEKPATPWAVNYNHREVGPSPMGYIVENRLIRQAIVDRARLVPELEWLAPAQVSHTRYNPDKVNIHLADGRILTAALRVGAEGRFSPTREEAGLSVRRWNYHQAALVAHASHKLPHQGTAWEIFQADGPFAILPMQDCPVTGAYRSGIVWTGSPSRIEKLLEMSDAAISQELEGIFPYFGCIQLSGRRWSYPLSAMVARECTGNRLVIVGDAAHVVHPVAGQGVNLGWRDAQTLAAFLGKSKMLGLDLGSKSVLKAWQQQRRLDTLSVLAITEGMVRLFSNNSSILHFLRSAGLGVVNQLPFVKRRLMRQAMGV